MNIRAVTAFVDVSYPLDETVIARAGETLKRVRAGLEASGFTVQTARLASQPIADAIPPSELKGLPAFARDLEKSIKEHGIDYASLGNIRLTDDSGYLAIIPATLGETQTIFMSAEIARVGIGVDLARIKAAANAISQAATITADGFGNLRLAMLANVRAWSPFFPAAHHGGGKMRMAVATESADVALTAITSAKSLAEARQNLVAEIERLAGLMEKAAREALNPGEAEFQGIDFSLAPYPEDSRSIGAALEALGLPAVGSAGTLFAAAFLTEAIERARFTRTGFCGLMLPVLEDSVLARRASESLLNVTDLLTYSAVCGTGLDTLPLPGDMTGPELAAILLDVAALALRLDKQLTARLMPLPGKKAGDPTNFDFEFFAPSRVLAVTRGGLTGLLAGAESIDLSPRHSIR